MRNAGVTLRCFAVWCLVTCASWWLGRLCLPELGPLLDPGRLVTAPFEEALVPLAALVALAAGLRLWWLTTTTVWQLQRGSRPVVPDTLVRRLVLLACGGTLALGALGPAHAASGTSTEDRSVSVGAVLDGLTLPERAALPHPTARPDRPERTRPAGRHLVRDGESLWSIARDLSGPAAADRQVDQTWRRIHRLNDDVVGPDPDLIHPGQALRLPAVTDREGERP